LDEPEHHRIRELIFEKQGQTFSHIS